nr:hypothetical protein [Tanacetum cinerariifolium]
MTYILDIPNPIPLNTFIPTHLLNPEEQQNFVQEFTDQLLATTSLKLSPTPLREPTPPRDEFERKESKRKIPMGQSKKLGLPPPLKLAIFRITTEDQKREKTEIIKEEYGCSLSKRRRISSGHHSSVDQDIKFHLGGGGTQEEDEMFRKLELTIKARDDAIQARKIIKDN